MLSSTAKRFRDLLCTCPLTNLPFAFSVAPLAAFLFLIPRIPALANNICERLDPEYNSGGTTCDLSNRGETLSLGSGNFKDLSDLEVLDLSNNGLTRLEPGVFNGLSDLEVLDLSGNSLTRLRPDVFNDLSHLEKLDLRSNRLTSLPSKIFNNLERLEWLALEHNRLVNLPVDIFNTLTNLENLYII